MGCRRHPLQPQTSPVELRLANLLFPVHGDGFAKNFPPPHILSGPGDGGMGGGGMLGLVPDWGI
jgi:hypothetical protein